MRKTQKFNVKLLYNFRGLKNTLHDEQNLSNVYDNPFKWGFKFKWRMMDCQCQHSVEL